MTPPIPPPPRGYKLLEDLNSAITGRWASYSNEHGWEMEDVDGFPICLSADGRQQIASGSWAIAVPDPAYDWRVDAMEFWPLGLDSTHTGEMTKGGVHHAEIKGMAMDFDPCARIAELEAKLAILESAGGYIIHKASRVPGIESYMGTTWDTAGLRHCYKAVYASREEAEDLAAELTKHNAVGFTVVSQRVAEAETRRCDGEAWVENGRMMVALNKKLADAEARCERLRKELVWHKRGTVGESAEEKVAKIERGEDA